MSTTFALTVIEEHGARPDLAGLIESVHATICVIAEEFDVPEMMLTVVLTGDITASVRAHSEIERDFTPERSGGGIVKGKTISLVRDFSETVIVLDAGDATVKEELDQVELLHLIAHEYGHAIIGRLRAVAGTRPPKTARDKTPEEAAAIWAYEAADEFRCDMFSNALLGQFATVTPRDGGESRPLNLADFLGEDYRNAFSDLLDDVHPGWADLVHAYRTHKIGLNEMYGDLLFDTAAMLNLIAHADAVEKARGNEPLLTGYADHPAVQQLLGPVWTHIREVLNTTGTLPPLADFAAVDRALQDCGRQMVAMWASLGVTAHLTEDDQTVRLGELTGSLSDSVNASLGITRSRACEWIRRLPHVDTGGSRLTSRPLRMARPPAPSVTRPGRRPGNSAGVGSVLTSRMTEAAGRRGCRPRHARSQLRAITLASERAPLRRSHRRRHVAPGPRPICVGRGPAPVSRSRATRRETR
ncbi:hypothetical protein [Streptomyces flavidovirens]|uniref:hypothetical protein n=1 Tax=Streptomyces flavidovirens TaxID=67298 RepID=UPI0003FEF4EF|nr:hypothetical protein [Streptomyces flavidovirens]